MKPKDIGALLLSLALIPAGVAAFSIADPGAIKQNPAPATGNVDADELNDALEAVGELAR